MQNNLSTIFNQSAQVCAVDSHFHVFEADKSIHGARYTPDYDAPLANWQACTQAVGITHGVLVQTSFMGTDNSLLLQQLAAHPETLRGVAVVSPTVSQSTLANFHAQGVRGIRLNLAGSSHDMSAWAAVEPLWRLLEQLGWHVELHTDAGALPAVLAAVPMSVPVVIDHFGKPSQVSANDDTVIAVRKRSANGSKVHIKLSAAYRLKAGLDSQDLAALWHGELGIDALLWGSDWPCTNFEAKADYAALHRDLQDWLRNDDAAIQAVRATNPMLVYWG